MSCQPNIPNFVSPECPNETGRVVALGLIHKNIWQTIYDDPDNPAVWVDQNYASDLHIFGEVRGTYTGGSVTEVPGFGKNSSRPINAEHVLDLSIEGVKNNENFWNEIVKSNNFRPAFVVGGDYNLLMIGAKDASIYGTPPVEEGLDTEVVWKVQIKWRDLNNPKTSDVPTGIFS